MDGAICGGFELHCIMVETCNMGNVFFGGHFRLVGHTCELSRYWIMRQVRLELETHGSHAHVFMSLLDSN